MSGRTNSTISLMAKPLFVELRAMHVLIVGDDERKVLQKLEVSQPALLDVKLLLQLQTLE